MSERIIEIINNYNTNHNNIYNIEYKETKEGKYYMVYIKHSNKKIYLFAVEDENGDVLNGVPKKKGYITTWTDWYYIHKLNFNQTLASYLGLRNFFQHVKSKVKVSNKSIEKGNRYYFNPRNKSIQDVKNFLDNVVKYYNSNL